MKCLGEFEVTHLSEEAIREMFVGRIDYFGFSGEMEESLYFMSREDYLNEIEDSIDIGRLIKYEDY